MQTDLQEKIKELQRKIAREITYFQTGGVRPRGAIDECWIGRVLAYAADEELPVDQNGADASSGAVLPARATPRAAGLRRCQAACGLYLAGSHRQIP